MMTLPAPWNPLLAVALCGGLLLLVGSAGALLAAEKRIRPESWLNAALTVALAGYAAFWAGIFHPAFGRFFSWFAFAAAAATCWRMRRPGAAWLRAHRDLLLVGALVAVGYGATLYLFPAPTWSTGAASRFLADMPGDNELPRVFTEVVSSGNPTRVLGGDWLTSDRPPLQTGVALLTWPVLRTLGFDLDTACAATGLWLQLLWIPALHLLLRSLGVDSRRATAVVAALAFTGFLLFNSVYVWPKLAAAAFVVIAFVEWFLRPATSDETEIRFRYVRAGTCAGCAWLLHGGVTFALLALVPFVFAAWRRWRSWLWAGLAFIVLALPWLAYQRGYAPPGNRLVKWHIAGVIPPDSRSVGQALHDSYAKIGWSGAWDARCKNLAMLFGGSWSSLVNAGPSRAPLSRRVDDQYFPLRTAALWWLALGALPFWAVRQWRTNFAQREAGRNHGLTFGWLAGTCVAWVALMFFPNEAFTHQGSYTVQLLLLGLLAAWAVLAHPLVFATIAAIQAVEFAFTWLPPGRGIVTPLSGAAAAVTLASGLGLIYLIVTRLVGAKPNQPLPDAAAAPAAPPKPQWRDRFFTPTLLWGAVVIAILFARRPEMFLHPQLWAEDGPIFFLQADTCGLGALQTPYGGYHHFLLRLIAAAAAGLDARWIPAAYLTASLTTVLMLGAAIFSPRIDLPRRAACFVAIALLPHSGEVFGNLANLQWLSALGLVWLLLARDAATPRQSASDTLLAVVVGLTGIFSILLTPLFVWRAWRRKSRSSALLAVLVALTASVQAWTVLHSPAAPPGIEAFTVGSAAWFTGYRLTASLLLPATWAEHLPRAGLITLGVATVLALLATAVVPGPRRDFRLLVVASLLAVVMATIFRARHELSVFAGLRDGDRYLFVPKVLAVWLLVGGWSGLGWIRWSTGVASGLALLATLAAWRYDPLKDYQWSQYARRIQAGEAVTGIPINPGMTFDHPGRP